MANEISMTVKITFNKTPVANVERDETDVGVDVTGTRYHQGVQEVGTTEEVLVLGDIPIASLGYCWLKNLDATNFVQFGPAAADAYLIKLKTLESALFRLNLSITPVCKADTAACDVEVLIIED